MASNTSTSAMLYYAVPVVAGAAIAASAWWYKGCRFGGKKFTLDPEQWQRFELVERLPVTHNASIFRFKLPRPTDSLSLSIGRHLQIRAVVDGKEVVRSYTPVSLPDDEGFFELLVKVYPTGTVSKHIGSLRLGDFVECKGPKGHFEYRPNMVRHLGMIAGGTGITPMLQVIKAVLRNPDDHTEMSLVFGNLSEDDILLRKELDELASQHPERFRVHYVVNEARDARSWTGSTGLITPELIAKHLPGPNDDARILLCGPPPMNKAMAAHLQQLGHGELRLPSGPSDRLFKF